MRYYPALHVAWSSPATSPDPDLLLAAVDDYSPVAVDEHDGGLRVFFPSEQARDAARDALARFDEHLLLQSMTVGDEDWAERSQAALTPVTVGRITVAPPWAVDAVPDHIGIVIEPSMGFGTGHHASTRLCLRLLQTFSVTGQSVLDVGTGSGVLAIAAWRLGAASALGIDSDADAIEAATDSVSRNHAQGHVQLAVRDVTEDAASLAARFDLTFANLTGGLLMRIAPALVATLAPGGRLIASGFQTDERDDVVSALGAAGAGVVDEASEDGWVGAVVSVHRPSAPTASPARPSGPVRRAASEDQG